MFKKIVNTCAVLLFATLVASVVHAKDLPTVPISASILIQVPGDNVNSGVQRPRVIA